MYVCVHAYMSSDVITAIAFPWYCVVSHGMDFYDLCWHHVMIIRRSHMQLHVNHCQSIFMLDHALSFPHLIPMSQNLNPSDLSKNGTSCSFLCIG